MSALVAYALKGLRQCYLPYRHGWSYAYHLDGRPNPNESRPGKDAFYSLNVVLGLAAAGKQAWQSDYDLPFLLKENTRKILKARVPPYALGMALWAAAEAGISPEQAHGADIHDYLCRRMHWKRLRAQDVGMILTGISEQKHRGNCAYDEQAHALFQLVKRHYLTRSGLFHDAAGGFRKNFASFAAQAYLITACYQYGLRYGSNEALHIADSSAQAILALQGEEGDWPWFYHAPGGIIADRYEIYSVHQYGMAPLFLRFAEERGIPGARGGILKGFGWLIKNRMAVPSSGMFYRSLARKGELLSKHPRVIRSASHALTHRHDAAVATDRLVIRKECRSYELGWLLYAFANRSDMPEITGHPVFAAA